MLLSTIPPALLFLLIPIIIWEAVWKGIGLWKSARNNQMIWFLAILIINSAGIVPIVYLLFFQGKKGKKNRRK